MADDVQDDYIGRRGHFCWEHGKLVGRFRRVKRTPPWAENFFSRKGVLGDNGTSHEVGPGYERNFKLGKGMTTPKLPKKRRRRATPAIAVNEADRDLLDQYLFEVSKTPLLTPQEEIDLAKKVRVGDSEAMQELAKRNLRFVISVAKKYQNRGLPLTDLIGEGNVGLLTAARKFDPDQGVKFISYAVWWIRQAILASLARQGRTVRVPLNHTADLSKIVRTAEALRQELRREPTPEEISEATALSIEVVQSQAAMTRGTTR